MVTILNRSRSTTPPITAQYCPDFIGKLKGLMFRKTISPDGGIILDQKADSRLDSAIHMLFMNFDIAVIWVNSRMEVVDTRWARRWALAYLPKKPARYVIELQKDLLECYQPGDRLEFRYE